MLSQGVGDGSVDTRVPSSAHAVGDGTCAQQCALVPVACIFVHTRVPSSVHSSTKRWLNCR
jgi:hypothetical protein